MSPDSLIQVRDISKCYPVFAKPKDRLKQVIFPRLMRIWKSLFSSPEFSIPKYFNEFNALQNISLEVKKGEMVGVIGRNGSGKSTLLQIICGTLAATSGDVEVKGRVVALLELGAGFNSEFTGRENVFMNAAILGMSEQEILQRLDEIIAFADIGDHFDQPVKTYSSGMFMRLAFSVAVCVEPDIVVVDEALSVGDFGFSMKCMQRIEEMLANDVTFLLVTHDMALIRNMCSRAIYLKSGKNIFDGEVDTAVEMYLMDVRNDQASLLNQNVTYKPALNEDSIAFGTDEGRVISITASSEGEDRTWFYHGTQVCLDVKAWFGKNLKKPVIVLTVHDIRGYTIFGIDSRLMAEELQRSPDGNIHCRFSFDANMLPGTYSINIRIIDFPIGAGNILVERQVNAMTLQVMDQGTSFESHYGVVDLFGSCKQVL